MVGPEALRQSQSTFWDSACGHSAAVASNPVEDPGLVLPRAPNRYRGHRKISEELRSFPGRDSPELGPVLALAQICQAKSGQCEDELQGGRGDFSNMMEGNGCSRRESLPISHCKYIRAAMKNKPGISELRRSSLTSLDQCQEFADHGLQLGAPANKAICSAKKGL